MFANAGMVQFKDVFTGKEERPYARATSSAEVHPYQRQAQRPRERRRSPRGTTPFFEMLGNFSFGNYFKQDAIKFAWDYFIDDARPRSGALRRHRLRRPRRARTCRRRSCGDLEGRHGLSDERIIRCGAKDNFWQMGDTGPCGPCSRDSLLPRPRRHRPSHVRRRAGLADGRGWFELWNLVFMQFERHADGKMDALYPHRSIDTGRRPRAYRRRRTGGLEQTTTPTCCGRSSTWLPRSLGKRYQSSQSEDDVSMRVIADHARTAAFLISEGVFPDKEGRCVRPAPGDAAGDSPPGTASASRSHSCITARFVSPTTWAKSTHSLPSAAP